LQKVISERPRVRKLVLHFTEAMMSRVLQNVACNAVYSVEARCSRWILSIQDRLEHNAVPLRHEFLAEMLGLQRSTVSSTMRVLQGSGLIQQGRGVITVTDRAGLEATSCECYGTVRRSFERLLPYTNG
jgi:CRP-like cAMP-binding protein